MSRYSSVVIELHYLPCLEYFALLMCCDRVVVEACEHYVKQTYRNRCHVQVANGTRALTVPVVGGKKKVPVQDLAIDNTQDWVKQHWRTLQSAYGKSPFFEYYADGLQAIYNGPPTHMFALNQELLTYCLNMLQLDVDIIYTDRYEAVPENGLIDMRNQIHPRKGPGLSGIYQPTPYYQTFGPVFVQNLSVVDLLFNEGPNAKSVLRQSLQKG